jgi:23S rRNA pseudouridine1911/1915/1917 synthase
MSQTSSPIKIKILSADSTRLDKALAKFAPDFLSLSRSHAARLISSGAVNLDGLVIKEVDYLVSENQVWTVFVRKINDLETLPQEIPLDIVYEDDTLIVINKSSGMVVHPAPGSPDKTLVNALLYHCSDTLSGIGGVKRPGIVHRIDKDTSGLLVVAKSDRVHHGLARQFERHTVQRMYLALCYGVPNAADPRLVNHSGVNFEPGNIVKIDAHLARHKHDRQKQSVVKRGGRHAVTRARVVKEFGKLKSASLLECWLETGRTHQIRVHMSYIGHSLIGDPTYGGKRKLSTKSFPMETIRALELFPRQALHAAKLSFEHPINGNWLSFEAPVPRDFELLVSRLSNENGIKLEPSVI